MSSDQDKKKKRRWDVPGGESNAPSTPAPQQNIQQNAATNTASGSNLNTAQLAAAKLQQILAQKGMSVIPDAGATAELEINDYSPDVRALLTRGATHDQIRAETGATILSRGYYLAPGTQSSTERPLYLLISGESAVVVEKAKEKLQEIINKAQTQLTVKVYIGLENSRPEFGLIPRLLGKQGSFVKYINNETGAKIQLHGRGSGYLEPHSKLEAPDALHFVLSAPTQLALDKAKSMAKDLIDHVQRDFAKAYQHPTHVAVHYPAVPLMPYPPPPPGTGVMIPPPTHMYGQMPPPPSIFVPVPPITATANVPLYPELKTQEHETETHVKGTEGKEDSGVSVGPRRPTAADIEQSRSRLVELPDHVYESHSASEDERSDAERMPPPPPVAPGTVSPAKRKRRNSLTHATDDKFPAPKRQKVSSEHSDEESSGDEGTSGFKLVNYDETEDDDKYTAPRNKTPFWAAPPPGKPIFSVLGQGDKDEEEDDDDQTPVLGSSSGYTGRDYDKLHSEVMKELGLK